MWFVFRAMVEEERELVKMEHPGPETPVLLVLFLRKEREPISHTLLTSSVLGYNENPVHQGSGVTATLEKGNP